MSPSGQPHRSREFPKMVPVSSNGYRRFGASIGPAHRTLRCRVSPSLFRPVTAYTIMLTAVLCFESSILSVVSTAEKPVSGCEITDSMTLCTCDASDGSPQNLEARLSASHKELKLLCKDGLRYAPDGLMSSMVCPMKAADLGKCKAVSDGAKPIDVKELLSWHPANVLWKVDATAAQDVPRVLAITEKSLPSVDRKFIVGCLKGNEDTAQCTLTVTVKAKATWRTSRTVSCAYGKESNGTPQSIILTPAERSYTLVCGADGEIVPNNYKEVFCPVGTPSSDRDPRCYDRYAAVLPGYEKKWWHEGANNSFTFAVPEDSFPDKEASISVRCRKKQQNKDPAAPLVESAASVCSLSIKVEGVGRTRFMPNISAPRTVDRFGVASGGAFFLTSLAQIL